MMSPTVAHGLHRHADPALFPELLMHPLVHPGRRRNAFPQKTTHEQPGANTSDDGRGSRSRHRQSRDTHRDAGRPQRRVDRGVEGLLAADVLPGLFGELRPGHPGVHDVDRNRDLAQEFTGDPQRHRATDAHIVSKPNHLIRLGLRPPSE
jgi:hypothetical protein